MDAHPLKEFRQRHDPPLTQRRLAELLGVSIASVSRWEAGKRKIDLELLRAIARKTGIAPTELRPDLKYSEAAE
jgi:transcriptional regulator with XRE-family HTH domain